MVICIAIGSGARAPTRVAEEECRFACFKKPSGGFTLIELMLCVCIFGLLCAIATPFYLSYREDARVAAAISDMKTIEAAIGNYVADYGQLPDSLAQIGMDGLLDPWQHPYQYLRIDGGNVKGTGKMRKDHFMVPVNTDYDLYSMGPDGKSEPPFTAKASQDDIVRANNGGYYGKVSNF
jgi:general secretion pathway protein G